MSRDQVYSPSYFVRLLVLVQASALEAIKMFHDVWDNDLMSHSWCVDELNHRHFMELPHYMGCYPSEMKDREKEFPMVDICKFLHRESYLGVFDHVGNQACPEKQGTINVFHRIVDTSQSPDARVIYTVEFSTNGSFDILRLRLIQVDDDWGLRYVVKREDEYHVLSVQQFREDLWRNRDRMDRLFLCRAIYDGVLRYADEVTYILNVQQALQLAEQARRQKAGPSRLQIHLVEQVERLGWTKPTVGRVPSQKSEDTSNPPHVTFVMAVGSKMWGKCPSCPATVQLTKSQSRTAKDGGTVTCTCGCGATGEVKIATE